MDPKDIRDQLGQLADKLVDKIPEGAKQLPESMRAHFHQLLQETFEKMDLVTREELKVQSKVLERTREKVEALEQQVAELEKRLSED